MIDKTLKALLVANAMLGSYLIGTLEPRVIATDNHAVQAICEYSASVRSGEWEEACGLAQDVSNIPYKDRRSTTTPPVTLPIGDGRGLQEAATYEQIQATRKAF